MTDDRFKSTLDSSWVAARTLPLVTSGLCHPATADSYEKPLCSRYCTCAAQRSLLWSRTSGGKAHALSLQGRLKLQHDDHGEPSVAWASLGWPVTSSPNCLKRSAIMWSFLGLSSPFLCQPSPGWALFQFSETVWRQLPVQIVQIIADNLMSQIIASRRPLINCSTYGMRTRPTFLRSPGG